MTVLRRTRTRYRTIGPLRSDVWAIGSFMECERAIRLRLAGIPLDRRAVLAENPVTRVALCPGAGAAAGGPPSASLPSTSAWAWELSDRGLVRTGFKAELVLFDEQRVRPAMPKVETRRELVRRRR